MQKRGWLAMKKRGWRAVLVFAIGALASLPLQALMAGAAPDSPTRRIDANSPLSRWTSVVAVVVEGGIYSGVVIAPRHVLTAAHVVGGATADAISVQVNATSTPRVVKTLAVAVFPGASFPYDDLAVVELAEPVGPAVVILPLYRSPVSARQVVSLVGYGASGGGDKGPTIAAAAGVKRQGRNVVDALPDHVDGSGRKSRFYRFDFDGPAGFGPLGGPGLGNGVETGFAPGDSGSPAFADIDGHTWLIGISNHVASPAGRRGARFGFGSQGGGLLLSDPRFLRWLAEQTHGTIAAPEGDRAGERR
jgi:hypothetical protein